MAGAKETPRQKMIGMMYLVLLAMLAMNVSKEVLDAFILIDDALVKTNANFEAKNATSYVEINNQYNADKLKVKSVYDKSNKVKQLADDMDNYIEQLKQTVIFETQGYAESFSDISEVPDSLYRIKNFKTKDDYSKPSHLLIGSEAANPNDGPNTAVEFKQKLEGYKSDLEQILGAQGQKTVTINLDLSEVEQPDGTFESWELGNFNHLPVAAVVTNFSRFQAEVRNAEADVLTYLLSTIGKKDFKFDTLAVKVLPNSDYIIQGDSFKAQVIVAAYSTTQNPKLEVGSDIDTAGSVENWSVKNPFDSSRVKVEDGVATYGFKTSATGEQDWGGFIKIKKPGTTDEYEVYPFKHSFIVAAPSLTVSPTAMNVVYRGLSNPVKISVAGVADSKIKASVSNGSISQKEGNEYIVKPGSGNTCNINVKAEMNDGTLKDFGSMEFRVQDVPNPVGMFAGIKGSGSAPLAQLKATDKIYAILENFMFEGVKFQVVGFELSGVIDGNFRSYRATGDRLTSDMKDLINRQFRGQKVFVENIRVKGPDGKEKTLFSGVNITIK
tara:strand:- start:219 stop:1880 length:1662 start_codon:yes stop_codon:yes gene_type:complete